MKYLKSTVIYILFIVGVLLGFVGLGCLYLVNRNFELVDFIDDCMVSEDETNKTRQQAL